ncbi:YrrS family protein [Paucisalibacillus sp. EB02]|uniref:YrrS family protein n=1 Tax=Paucisalibacillus sp. EB02 TaxID=1347087 RepID=UPI0004B13085|nr:YrrS family protein [Paucisalibacillus sp. EB02]
MSDFDRYTRVNKFEKRRKNTKLMSLLTIAGSFLIILLIGLWIFGPDDEPEQPNNIASSNDNTTESENQNEEENIDETGSDTGQDSTESEESSTQTEEDESNETESGSDESNENLQDPGEKEQVDPAANDDKVVEAYTKNWQPIGTEQEGTHSVVYEDGSQDRIEMEKALQYATGLSEDNIITWWLQRNGDQNVIGTVSDKAETQTYRVYISWVDNQGWQPTLVEVLSENDQKWRFE